MTVQQLDKNMSNLRTWLSRIEAELAKPVVYDVCHGDEIQKKLAEQQVGRSILGLSHITSVRRGGCFQVTTGSAFLRGQTWTKSEAGGAGGGGVGGV